jgi:beta-glucosidase
VVVGYTKADEGEFIDVGTSEAMMTMFPPAPAPAPATAGEEAPRPPARSDEPPPAPAPDPVQDTFAPGGDRRSLRLAPDDQALIRATVAVCRNTVVAVMGDSAVVMPWLEEVPATLVVWYPGMEGGAAFGDVLTGACEPGGRLPFALPRDETDLVAWDPDVDAVVYGLFHGQWKLDRDGVVAHRPFGAGLGYTDWAVDPSSVRLRQDAPGSPAGTVDLTVVNTGTRAGSTVVFLFAGLPDSSVDRPVRRLVGFARVALGAGSRATVGVAFDLATLAVRRDGTWFQEPGRYALEVGTDAGAVVASVVADVTGPG